ncbi:oxysterol-binding protein-related protein 9-like isoform X2 [Mytilus californianus]|uniref:oxysterol-binding protein-related protein 9-like isoform X2 n=1 Tax=Mytilus californianus TaxID=6549 RepID=UPI00224536BE|nr:oxysterol-binding protein-related protein 9-like isoform X2 [Mytilus californianus]
MAGSGVIEGPLSKWTNVMKGWQYRWFVLDEASGLLSYYTSKEKMMRGSRRGCVRLKGAIIGIDDEDDSTFTLSVDQKTFHFQARDGDEREKWIQGLENAILRHSADHQVMGLKPVPTEAEFEFKLAETDAYLQLMIEQVKSLETRIDACEDESTRERYNVIKVTAEAMIEAIKHAIVMLQISKESLKGPVMNGSMHESILTNDADYDYFGTGKTAGSSNFRHNRVIGIKPSVQTLSPEEETLPPTDTVPERSYSSSEDEDFYDAEDFKSASSTPQKGNTPDSSPSTEELIVQPQVIASDDDYYDELYDELDKENLGSLEKHGSVIAHLLSQVRIGMDLTKVVLPTFILERRSLLEMYADFFAHPDLFLKIPELTTPRERMIQLVRWYLSAFHAGRNSEIAKKPYNPILGETFTCFWKMPGAENSNEQTDGPVPWASKDNLAFIAEQVSHHPPISAFYAEHFNKKISLDGYIWTKSKFLGLSIGVHMIGQGVISVIDYDEEYTITFPNGYGRSILTVPWIELGGKCTLSCAKTGYNATVEFHTKPFYGGKKHKVTAEIFEPNEKKPIVSIDGEWNGIMYAKYNTGMNEVFVDTKKMPIMKKLVKPTDQQTEFESRRLWKEVTYNLKNKFIEEATNHKQRLEQRQRNEAKERKEKGLKVETKCFHEEGEHWVYDRPLLKRVRNSPSSTL